MSPPVQPIPANAALYTGGASGSQSLLDPAQPQVLPPTQVLANAHLLRSQHGWSQADVDAYVRDESGLPTMVSLAQSISAPKPGEDQPGLVPSIAAKFGQGASFNFADRLAGGVDALLASVKAGHVPSDLPSLLSGIASQPEAYTAGRDQARDYYAAAQAAHPVASTIANGLGNAASTMVGGSLLEAPTSILGAAGQGGLIGGGSSAAATLGNQPDLTDPSAYLNALKSGAIGGGTGAALGAGGQFLVQRLFGRAGPQLTKAIQASGGEDALREAAAAQEAAGRGMSAGGVPADLSPELQGLANPAVNAASPGVRAPLQEAILARNAGQPQRLAEDLRDLFGTELNGPARQAELQQMVRSIENDPTTGYQALNEAVGPIMDPRLGEFLSRPAVRSAYQQALENIGTSGGPKISLAAFEAGKTVPEEALSFQALNGTRKTLANIANAAYRAGRGDQGAAFKTAADELKGIIADNVPAFTDLQGRVAQAKTLLDAANEAGDVLTNETLHGLADKVNGLSPDALTEFRRGLAAKMYDQLASMRTGRGIANTLLTDPGLQAKLKVAFGDAETFQRFMDRVGAEKAWSGTGAIFGNSLTAPRQAAAAEWGALPVHGGLSLSPEGVHPYLFASALKGSPSTTANPLARALLTPQSVDRFLETVRSLNSRGLPFVRGLTALPGAVTSPATQ